MEMADTLMISFRRLKSPNLGKGHRLDNYYIITLVNLQSGIDTL
jgi:hypothetical protein